MVIQELHLYNFRQYKDFIIEFSDKNGVTVVRANNSIGKTTLMQSIKWVLFGNDALELDNKDELMNYSVVKEKKENLSAQGHYYVEISLFHNNKNYTLKREYIIDLVSNSLIEEIITLTFLENGETKIFKNNSEENKNKIHKVIESWITEKMLGYFFLDGERIEKLSQVDSVSQAELSDAITSVSKIPVLANSIETVEVVLNDVKRQEAKATRNIDLVQLQREISELESEKRFLENEKSSHELDDSNIHEEILTIDNTLLNTREVSKLQHERTKTQKELNDINVNMRKILKNIQVLNRDYRREMLIYMLYQKYNINDLRGKEAEKTIPNMEVNAIDQIIKNGVCICGTHLEQEHIYNLEQQKSFQPPISNEGLLITYEHLVQAETWNLDRDYKELTNEIENYFNNYDRKCELVDYQNDINNKINEFNVEDIKNLNIRRDQLIVQQDEHKNSIAKIKHRLDELEKLLKRKQNKYEKKLENYEQNKIIENKRYLIKEVSNMLNNKNEEEKEIQRKSIQKYANKHFSEIISKDKFVTIDNKYRHIVKDANENEIALSSGESIALSVSIILAIIDTHKNNLQKNNKENILAEREFFLILDGAFAVLDQNFSKAIAEKITNSLNQVILLTNDNQYTDSVKEAVKPKLNEEYILNVEDKWQKENILTEYLAEVN